MERVTPGGTSYSLHGQISKPKIILIHGLGLNKKLWQWLLPDLLDDYCTITYDIYGHGNSKKASTEPTLKLFSDQINELLNTLNIKKVTIIGFSLGGMIARRFAQDHPSMTKAICVISSPHKRTTTQQTAIEARWEKTKAGGAKSTVTHALDRWFTKDFIDNNSEVMALIRSWVLDNETEVYEKNYKVLSDGVDEIIKPQPAIKCPALIITGEYDEGNGPEMSKAIALEINGSDLFIIKGLKHMALVEDPIAFKKPLITFLSKKACV